MDEALVLAKDAAIQMDNVPADFGIRPNFSDNAGIIPIGYKTDVLTIGLHRHD